MALGESLLEIDVSIVTPMVSKSVKTMTVPQASWYMSSKVRYVIAGIKVAIASL